MDASIDRRKTCLITGCTPGGIGHSMALVFHRRGYRVFATARRPEVLSDLASKGIETLPLEVNSESSLQTCLSTIKSLTGNRGLDFLVNNAGVNYTVPALDVNIDEAKRVFDTNVFAVMRICQLFAPLLIQAKGTIVMIASVAGAIPYVFGSVYNASKAALQAYSNTLRVELAQFDVHVSIIMTGGVKSQIATHVHRVLPEDSLYADLDEIYQRRQTHSQEDAMPNEEFAESVVSQVVPGGGPIPWRWFLKDARKRWIWEGKKSWVAWFLSGSWTWTSVGDVYMNRVFSLWKLREKAKSR